MFSPLTVLCPKARQFELRPQISNNVVCATSNGSDQPAHKRSLIRDFASRLKTLMCVKLLTEHRLEFLSLKGGCTGLCESTLVKIPHCWKSHVTAHLSSLHSSSQENDPEISEMTKKLLTET